MDPISIAVPEPMLLGSITLTFEQPLVMGVLNITPDSFSDGGSMCDPSAAVRRAAALVKGGAAILDVGGESTRPGARAVSGDEELDRVLPVLERLEREALPAAISIDTSKAEVAREAIARGATLINDVTGLRDEAMASVAAESGAALALMHMRGEPRTMQQGAIVYDDLLGEVTTALRCSIDRAVRAGVDRRRIMVDPGIGFGKTAQHNLSLTRHLGVLAELGCPILYGPSRKRFLGTITGRDVADRDRATAAVCVAAVLAGAHVLRVHDPAAVVDAVKVAAAVRDAA